MILRVVKTVLTKLLRFSLYSLTSKRTEGKQKIVR